MKILHLTTHLNRGGITSYLYNLSKALVQRGHLVFIASSGGNLLPEFEKAGIKHFPLPINTKSELSPRLWLTTFRLKKIVEKEKVDIIHTHTRVTHCIGWRISRKVKIHWLTTAHGYYKVRWGRRVFPAWGEKTIAISPAVKKHLLDDFKLPEDQVRMVFTGIDLEKFSPENNEEGGTFRGKFGLNNFLSIGMIGRISPEKGHHFFLEAATLLKEPKIKFVIVGSGRGTFQKELEPFLRDKKIIWIDYLESAEAFKLIDIFVQPSLQEGLGIALLEAMACAKAIVASRVGGIPAVIDDGIDGILVPPGDSKSLAQKILQLIQDENLRNSMGKAARKKVEDKFNVRKMALCTESVYKELLQHD